MYIYDDCGNAIPTPACEVCGDIELGRIRSAGFIRSDVTIADPTDPTDWSGPIAAGTVLVIPNTQGEFDGGTAKIVPGYGQVHERRISSLFKLKFIDPNYIGNAQFYNSIQKDFNWKPFLLLKRKYIWLTALRPLCQRQPCRTTMNQRLYGRLNVHG